MPGRSFLSRYAWRADKTSPPREAVFSGRERHSSSRYHSLGYPCRCIRTKTHLYIRNFAPERWPAGHLRNMTRRSSMTAGQIGQQHSWATHGGYHDIDDGPTLRWMIANREQPSVEKSVCRRGRSSAARRVVRYLEDPGCLT